MPKVEVRRKFEFEAAHKLPNYDGACCRIHGHTYKLEVAVKAEINPTTGMVMDFKHLSNVVKAIVVDKLDHQWLNDFYEMPTAETMVVDIWVELHPHLPELTEIVLYETTNSCAKLTRADMEG